MSSRSSSPATDYTDNSDVPTRASKRRRGDFLRLRTAPSSDDGSITDTDLRNGERVGLSPFYHPSTPAHEVESTHDIPMSYHSYQYHNLTSPAGPVSDHPPPGILKFAEAPRKDGRSKRQALACLFCRERKIACGRPADGSPTKTCNQCVRRGRECVYPTESRRGQHSRIKSLARRAQMAHQLSMGMMLPILN
ncbi:hypothetical protein DFH06DRAFT_448604 [Mycena polygramma]|nr:hypothetical protein DFH06DRAFT_448604 [Mycena polygramma]